MTGTSCIFSKLDEDIMNSHILRRLDGTDLTALSSVSPYLRHLICNNNNQDLWRNICTSKWPSLMDPIVNNVISTFPGGYSSFFSDVFPSLHHHNNSHCSYPPPPELIHAIDIYINGEPVFSIVRVERFNTKNWPPYFFPDTFDINFDDWKIASLGHIHIPVNTRWFQYLQENMKLSWILIDPTRKRAANLFRSTCKPLSVTFPQVHPCVYYKVVYGTVIAGECQVISEMVNCHVKVIVIRMKDGLYVRRVGIGMEDMSIYGDLVTRKQGITILLNAIQNGERKKFDLSKQEFDKFQIRDFEREKASRLLYDRLQRKMKYYPKVAAACKELRKAS